jgi:hypothetical protein
MPRRLLVRYFLPLLLLAGLASAAPAPSTPALFAEVGPILNGLSQITGWKVERKVPAELLSRDKFRHYMESGVNKTNPKEVRAEELTLKMFGLVPQNFDLADETVDLYSEQAAAFYDYKKKRLFVLEGTPAGEEQRLALVHELAHALADQHHPLGKYLRQGSPDDDATTARQAVMEGQATWLSWAYLSMRSGGKGEVPKRILDELADSAGADGPNFPVYSSAPLYVRESLIFPYDQGTRFEDNLYHRLGRESFDEVFENPPRSTHEILHPEAYFSGPAPLDPAAPPLSEVMGKKEAKRFKVLTEGSLGEFDFSALLRQYAGKNQDRAVQVASHWRGGFFRLYENKHDKTRHILAYTADWDDPEAAYTYFTLYRRVLEGKWKRMDIADESGSEVSGTGDTGRFVLRLKGTTVQSIEGLR